MKQKCPQKAGGCSFSPDGLPDVSEQLKDEPKKGTRAATRDFDETPQGLQGMQFIASKILWIRPSKKDSEGNRPELLVRATAVYNNPKGNTPFAFYATNSITKSGNGKWHVGAGILRFYFGISSKILRGAKSRANLTRAATPLS